MNASYSYGFVRKGNCKVVITNLKACQILAHVENVLKKNVSRKNTWYI